MPSGRSVQIKGIFKFEIRFRATLIPKQWQTNKFREVTDFYLI